MLRIVLVKHTILYLTQLCRTALFWYSATYQSSNLHHAHVKLHPITHTWFTHNHQSTKWLQQSVLYIYITNFRSIPCWLKNRITRNMKCLHKSTQFDPKQLGRPKQNDHMLSTCQIIDLEHIITHQNWTARST